MIEEEKEPSSQLIMTNNRERNRLSQSDKVNANNYNGANESAGVTFGADNKIEAILNGLDK